MCTCEIKFARIDDRIDFKCKFLKIFLEVAQNVRKMTINESEEKMEVAQEGGDIDIDFLLPSERDPQELFDELLRLDNEQIYRIQSLALTIEAVCSEKFELLVTLFEFYLAKNFVDMAIDLFERTLLKNFDFFANSDYSTRMEKHLNLFTSEIIRNLCPKKNFLPFYSKQSDLENLPNRDIYMQIFTRMKTASQEKFVGKTLEKLAAELAFLKSESTATAQSKTIDISSLYSNMSKFKHSLYKFRDLLLIKRQFIPEYGLSLIDTFLNLEKNMYVCLAQQSASHPQFDAEILNVERRSLNIMRRLCVIEFCQEFLDLIDKLDNRHCYRWIEKSLEFYTKYAMASTEVKTENERVQLNYASIKLLQVNIKF
jgi:hypothetical protein